MRKYPTILFVMTKIMEMNYNEQNQKDANKTHYNVGAKVRKTIKELGGTMPEDLPTPKKSLKQLEKENKKALKKQEKQKFVFTQEFDKSNKLR